MKQRCEMRMTRSMYEELSAHLFPGDGDEHGAVIQAGLLQTRSGPILTARALVLAEEGKNWVPGNRGYRMLLARFIAKQARLCRDEKLVYLAVHNHGGNDSVAFSSVDIESHERGFPALLDLVEGMPVGSLVFAPNAVAGDIWFPGGERLTLDRLVVVGAKRKVLRPRPERTAAGEVGRFDRQVRLFGVEGQAILAGCRVAIIGLGGVGSLLVELLARLGVGQFSCRPRMRRSPVVLSMTASSTVRNGSFWERRSG